MNKTKEKLIALALEKYPHITQKNAEDVANKILAEEREKIRKESQSDVKSSIKRKAGLK